MGKSCVYSFKISLTAATMQRAEIPNMSISTVGGPERGISSTPRCFTTTLRWPATVDRTASPRPPCLEREKEMRDQRERV